MLMPVYQNFGPGVTGAGTPIALDYLPFSMITAVVEFITPGSVTVEVSMDQIFDADGANYISPAAATWLPVQVTAPVVNPFVADGYVTFPGPWRAIRANVGTNADGMTFVVAQSTSPRA